jgi:DNA-directed RNA polymerase subunit RPC12/RpoP
MVSSSSMKYDPTPRHLKTRHKLYECLRCGYRWTPYAGKRPKRCARCQSPYWDQPRTRGVAETDAPREAPDQPPSA